MSNNTRTSQPLKIDWLNAAGHGGSRVKNQTIVIPGTLPGDEVTWSAVRTKGKRHFGELNEVTVPSPWRTRPSCRWNDVCGGCDMAHLNPDGRGTLLGPIAARALEIDHPITWVPSPRSLGHRARIKLSIQNGKIGYQKERSHELAPVLDCQIARPEVAEALRKLTALPFQSPLQGIEIRSDGHKVALDLLTKGSNPLEVADLQKEFQHLSINGKTLQGDPTLTLEVGGLNLRASPGVFYQVNLEVNALLVEFVRSSVHATKPSRVLDLFAGIGNFGLPLANDGVDVVAVEHPGRAIEDLRHTAANYGLTERMHIVALDARKFDPTRTFFDVAIVDPPRVGTMGGLAKLLVNRPTDVFYVSCHLSSASKEIREALKSGYELADVRCFDMFPDTRHFETVVHLKRR